jgi:hypothetical protein
VQRPQRSEDERRGQRRAPAHHGPPRKHSPQKGRNQPNCTFTIPIGGVRLEPTKGRIRCRLGYGGPTGHAVSSLAPGPSPSRQPERRQMTQPTWLEVA